MVSQARRAYATREETLIFVGLMLKSPAPCLFADLGNDLSFHLLFISLKNRKYVVILPNLCCQMLFKDFYLCCQMLFKDFYFFINEKLWFWCIIC